VAISGFGAMRVIDVTPDKEVIIDNAHVVCWDAGLRHDITVGTSRGGLLGGLVNSQFSGEGMVIRFSGRGKVYVCSRNRVAFQRWAQPVQER
ncbi:MAG TPA: AIM24 family protein, partial [Telluria sp.]|nr:AIM24 family protein [Telluria sp.]